MSSHADTIRRTVLLWRGSWLGSNTTRQRQVQDVLAALDALLAENQRLRDALRISYPMTPVDCLLSDLESEGWEGFPPPWFLRRVGEFRDEIAREALAGDAE